jgi:hypothetical protein
MILNLYKSLSSAFLSTDKKYSVEHIAADSLFTHQSYRLGKDANKDKYLFFRILKEVLFKSFIKFKYYKFTNESTDVVAVLDNSFNYIEIRRNYIKKLSGLNVDLYFNKSQLLGFIGIISLIKAYYYSFFIFFKALFNRENKLKRLNLALIVKELPEISNLLTVLKQHKVNVLFDFANYEIDSNFLYLLLKQNGIKVYKVPSPGPLYMHNKNLLSDVLVISSAYQLEETKMFKHTILFDKLICFYPELSTLKIGDKKEVIESSKYVVGFYSHASWLREKENHSDNGLNLLEAEESLLKMINNSFINSKFSLLIFLHPREKSNIYETKVYYSSLLDSIEFDFAPLEIMSSESFYLCNMAVVTLSTILFERIFEGYKIFISNNAMSGFPSPDSKLLNICFSNETELIKLLNDGVNLSDSDFFQRYDLTGYKKEYFISNEYQ